MFYLMMRFILIYSKLYLFKALFIIQSFIYHSKLYLFKALFLPPLPSFPIIFIHFFQTLKFLPNPKNFKQTLSIACL